MNPEKLKSDWAIREALPSELNFIYSTWLNNYFHGSHLGKSCRKSTFFLQYPSVIDSILEKPSTKILAAYFPDVPNVILGYLVYEPSLLHFVFTKELYQKHGIAESLFLKAFETEFREGKTISFSHRTFSVEPILKKMDGRLLYNPFTLYQRNLGEEKS